MNMKYAKNCLPRFQRREITIQQDRVTGSKPVHPDTGQTSIERTQVFTVLPRKMLHGMPWQRVNG